MVADFGPANAEKLVEGAGVIVDGLDNFEARFLINDVALKLKIPWVYGGAIGSTGMTATFLPDEPPCFRCLVRSAPAGGTLTCDTAGVVNAAPWAIASMEAAEALKVLIADEKLAPVSRDLLVLDLWQRSCESLPLSGFADPECPACRGVYDSLEGKPRTRVTSLCGQNAVQIWDMASTGMPLQHLRERLSVLGPVESSPHMLRFSVGEQELVVFYDGRTIVRGTRDEKLARALYAKYIGT